MDITAKLWSYCHILRHDGIDYFDYIEQLTYLLFLKMASESKIKVPDICKWDNLLSKDGQELKSHYEYILLHLKNEKGILGQIFQEPISKIQNPTSLKKIINGIESVGWTKVNKDVQGEAFEGLLEKTASESKKGTGQFFTPRPLIQAIVNVIQPNPLEKDDFQIADVACGTAGFLTMAVEWAKSNVQSKDWMRVKDLCYSGQELGVRPYRLALMNLFLHDVQTNLTLGDSIYCDNNKKESIDCIITNPPFGTRGIIGPPKQRDFKVSTSNIQINFIQHIFETLKPFGRAAVVLPDSCLSEPKVKDLWKILIGDKLCNLHTILRLPKGTFTPYAVGVKASVVFLQKGRETKNIWMYDARSDIEDINKSTRPLNYEKNFLDFVNAYGKDPNGKSKRTKSQRFEKYSIKHIKERNYDISFNKLYIPPKLNQPDYYVDKLIENFEQQLNNLKKLKQTL